MQAQRLLGGGQNGSENMATETSRTSLEDSMTENEIVEQGGKLKAATEIKFEDNPKSSVWVILYNGDLL